MASVFRLENKIQKYAWGDTAFIPEFLGIENRDNEPFAELWMGAHPKAPSLVRGVPLNELIPGDRNFFLGPRIAAESGELPFLFKILSASKALSIQVHPDKESAAEGFERENRSGIPLDASERNYRDVHHKPELLCALTPFTALNSFRRPEEIESFFSPWYSLPDPADEAKFLETFLSGLLVLPDRDKTALAGKITEGLAKKEALTSEEEWILELNRQFPGDIGILSPWFLNLVTIGPGEALFLPERELHAYLKGSGLELMACSDNVLRCGLTKKHIDPRELLRIVNFRSRKPSVIRPVEEPGRSLYPAPPEEFFLMKLEPGGGITLPGNISVRIMLCAEGKVQIIPSDGDPETLEKGESCLIPYASGPVSLKGKGILYQASLPEDLP